MSRISYKICIKSHKKTNINKNVMKSMAFVTLLEICLCKPLFSLWKTFTLGTNLVQERERSRIARAKALAVRAWAAAAWS